MSKAQATLRRLIAAVTVATFVLGSLLAVQSAALAVGGQNGSLAGTVQTDQHEPVPDALVTAASPSGSYHARTDAKGFFSLLGLPADTYTVSIERAGFQTQTITGVTVLGDQTQNLNTIVLSRRVIGRVAVHAVNSAFQPSQTIDQTTLSGARISQALGTATSNNEEQLLLAAPGVQEDSSGNITIRGSQGTEIGYQFDGINFSAPFFDENGSAGAFKMGGYLNGFAAGTGGSVQVISGSGDATQGNIGAGAVNIVPPRGTYPASGIASYTFGSPYRQNQYDLDYGIATRNGSISNYLALDNDYYVPTYAPYGTDAATLGEYSGTSAIRHTDFMDNLIVRFGKNQDQSLQVLFRDMNEETFGDYGGLTNNQYYPYNPLTLGNLPGIGFAGQIPVSELGPTLPGYPTGAVNPVAPSETSSTPTHFLKIGYNATLGASTFLSADYFNWAQDQILTNVDVGNAAPLYQDTGGQRVGFDLNVSHQFGVSHTVTIATRFENDFPRWYGLQPQLSLYALLFPLIGYAPGNYPNLANFLTPVGGACPVPEAAGGCYIYDNDGHVPVTIPTWGIDYHGADFQNYGVGIRDQWTVSSKLKLDYGLREDGARYHWGTNPYQDASDGGDPSDVGTMFLSPKFATPNIIQPRFAAVYDLTPNDAIRASYGRSVEFAFGQTAGTPFNMTNVNPLLDTLAPYGGMAAQLAAPTCGSGYNNVPQGPGAKLNPGAYTSNGNFAPYYFPCTSYAQQLAWQYDQFFDAPDYGGSNQETFSNYDVEYSHQFTHGALTGWGLKLTGWWRRGFNIYEDVLLASGPPNPATGQTSGSTFNVKPDGIEKAFGTEFNVTTPDRPYGWSGYLTANYLSEFTTVPPACCGVNGQYVSDTLPGLIPEQFLNSGTMYRNNALPPLDVDTGISYKTRSGFKITPIFIGTTGYPIGVGASTIGFVNGLLGSIPSTNLGEAGPIAGVGGPNKSYNAPSYVDPALPGSYVSPNIAATRGYTEPGLAGGALSSPTDTLNLDLEYDLGHDGRNVIGMYVANVMNNHYGVVYDNNLYQPVSTGVAGPQTGQQYASSNPASPGYAYYIAGLRNVPAYNGGANYPFISPYQAGITFNFYVQRKF
jgi:hypothetical protein